MKKNSKGFMLIDTLIVSITVSAILIYLYFQFSTINDSYTKAFRYNTVNDLYSAYDVKENIAINGKDTIFSDVRTNSFVDLTNCSATYYDNTSYCSSLNERLNIKKVLITKGNLTDIQSLMKQATNVNNYDESLRDLISKTANSNTNYQIFVEFKNDNVAVVTYGTIFKVGDYVKMTPEKESFMTDPNMTGYSDQQEINPSELNLWRVIRINKDETVEMVSEYVSSTKIWFNYYKGYANYVGYLNNLASQYANSKFTIKTRHMGYNGQTQYISDTSKFDSSYPNFSNSPWSCSTGESCNPSENLGGGDEGYISDMDLVRSAVGSTFKDVNGVISSTWLASRFYSTNDSNQYKFIARYTTSGGQLLEIVLRSYDGYGQNRNSIRPIVTLKSGLQPIDGDGSEASPWVLE